MAMEYIYLDHDIKQPVALTKFKHLMYRYEVRCGGEGFLEILDHHGDRVASYHVKSNACYVLQRRNQSALQLHEVTPPRIFRERITWLFGFTSKHRCDSIEKFDQVCEEYEVTHHCSLIVRDIYYAGSYLAYAFAMGDYTTPVAHYCLWANNGAWAFFGDDTTCKFIDRIHQDLTFKFPLQYVIHQVKTIASLSSVDAMNFFHNELLCYDINVYYADDPNAGF